MESFRNSTLRVVDCTRLPPAEQETAIRSAAADKAIFEVHGWRAAERNLDYIAVWLARLVFHGPDGAYFLKGGIEGTVARALSMPASKWRVVSRTRRLGGAQVTLRVENFQPSNKIYLTDNAS